MKCALASFVLASIALSPMPASAATSVQLKVTGAIVPASCGITMPGGTIVDYGRIDPNFLNKDNVTIIGDDIRAKMQVTCDSPMLFAIRPTDERAATKISVPGVQPSDLFGLGRAGNVNIGAYKVRLFFPLAEGVLVNIVRIGSSGKFPQFNNDIIPNQEFGFTANVASTVITPYKDVIAEVVLTTYVNKTSALPMNREVKLDGLATFELIYL